MEGDGLKNTQRGGKSRAACQKRNQMRDSEISLEVSEEDINEKVVWLGWKPRPLDLTLQFLRKRKKIVENQPRKSLSKQNKQSNGSISSTVQK